MAKRLRKLSRIIHGVCEWYIPKHHCFRTLKTKNLREFRYSVKARTERYIIEETALKTVESLAFIFGEDIKWLDYYQTKMPRPGEVPHVHFYFKYAMEKRVPYKSYAEFEKRFLQEKVFLEIQR